MVFVVAIGLLMVRWVWLGLCIGGFVLWVIPLWLGGDCGFERLVLLRLIS